MKYFIIICISVCFSLATLGQDTLHYKIKKIECHSWPGDWEGCGFTITIYDDKTVEYKADTTYCKPIIGIHQRINEATYDSLIVMLTEAKFPELKDRYGSGVDCGSSVLTITYNGGKTKRITVICGDEPVALQNVLHLLHRLKDTEHWK